MQLRGKKSINIKIVFISFRNEKELLINKVHYGEKIKATSGDISPVAHMRYQCKIIDLFFFLLWLIV